MAKINKPKTMSLEKMIQVIPEMNKCFGTGYDLHLDQVAELDTENEWKKLLFVEKFNLTKEQIQEAMFWAIQGLLNKTIGQSNSYSMKGFDKVDEKPTDQIDGRTN